MIVSSNQGWKADTWKDPASIRATLLNICLGCYVVGCDRNHGVDPRHPNSSATNAEADNAHLRK